MKVNKPEDTPKYKIQELKRFLNKEHKKQSVKNCEILTSKELYEVFKEYFPKSKYHK